MVSTAADVVLAHQGGWDEAMFVVVPMIVLVGLLALAQRRARAENDADAAPATPGHAEPVDPDER